jgi:hypothetical protein
MKYLAMNEKELKTRLQVLKDNRDKLYSQFENSDIYFNDAFSAGVDFGHTLGRIYEVEQRIEELKYEINDR